MEEYSFCDELIDEYNIEELDSVTLKYRIDGFIYACGMDLSDSPCFKDISPTRTSYINKHKNIKGLKYNVNFTRSYDYENYDNFVLLGRYNKLDFYFVNYFTFDRKDRINELPFKISIEKVIDNIPYKLDIVSLSKKQARFSIRRVNEKELPSNVVNFVTNITDFSIILRLIKTFIRDPEIAYLVCKEVVSKSKKNIIGKNLDNILDTDKKLDEPIIGISKIIKKILNNN